MEAGREEREPALPPFRPPLGRGSGPSRLPSIAGDSGEGGSAGCSGTCSAQAVQQAFQFNGSISGRGSVVTVTIFILATVCLFEPALQLSPACRQADAEPGLQSRGQERAALARFT